MKLAKMLKNLMSNHMVILTVVAALVLIYFVNAYSAKKGMMKSGMKSGEMPALSKQVMHAGNAMNQPDSLAAASPAGPAAPAAPLGQNSGPAGVSGVATEMHGLPASAAKKEVVDPKQLLPKDDNNEFSKMNPMGAGDVANVSLLRAGHHVGINTVGQSLRNANLQLRSEPANPQLEVGPWNTSTIGPDFNRRPLEIGA
jgi:hypothetical protein